MVVSVQDLYVTVALYKIINLVTGEISLGRLLKDSKNTKINTRQICCMPNLLKN